MESGRLPAGGDGPSLTADSPPPIRRRLSMEEDLHYQHVMSAPPRRPSDPPPYDRGQPLSHSMRATEAEKRKAIEARQGELPSYCQDRENLPDYSTAIHIEGIFSKKHEIENTIKRAEDRQWHTVFVSLTGNALNVYRVKKDWGWGRTRDGPSISPDNPPWVKKSKLEKSYNLSHADAGIAADYQKRRYVIRVRAETDQFLLACVELETFVKWLELLFAAIDITAPIDDRDFPRDMSIPRIQRIRWYRGVPALQTLPPATDSQLAPDALGDGQESEPQRRLSQARRLSDPSPPVRHEQIPEPEPLPDPDEDVQIQAEEEANSEEDDDEDDSDEETDVVPPPRIDPIHRLSTTSYPNLAIDPHSGKWIPEHKWSSAHDLLYAKLCYSNLLFRSPRKSNYIIQQGKQWFVDWTTGRMVRVLPPAYGEIHDYFGPWQVVHTENRRI